MAHIITCPHVASISPGQGKIDLKHNENLFKGILELSLKASGRVSTSQL